MVRWRGVGGVLGVLAVLGGGPAAGQPPEAVRRAEPVVVTATRSEEPLEEIGASVTVIPAEVLEGQQYPTVEDALRGVPGLDVQRSGTPGKLSTVRIRGAGPAQVQVLVDGVRVKSVTSGDFDFSDLTLDDVERIEIVRGPQSTLYGADAIGGVINIITRTGRGAPSAFVDAEAGNYDTYRERVGVSGALGPWSLSLGASRLDFGGQFPNDEHRQTSVNARVGYALPNRGQLALVGRYVDTHRGIPFDTVFPDFDRNREQNDELTLLSLEWRQPWTAWYQHALRLSTVRSALTFRDPPDPGEAGATFRSDIVTERREVDWLHHFHVGRVDTLTLGVEYRHEAGENKGAFDRALDTTALLAQNTLRLFERVFLTAGLRYDHNSLFGDETTGRAALSYLLRATDTRLKASWAEGFRAPTFNDLFFPAFPPCPPFGNPALRPERSESWDLGVEQHLWRGRARVGVTYFRNDFEDLIQFGLVDPANFCFQAQNVGRARTQGVEVEASVAPLAGLVLTVAYTHTDTEDRTTGLPLRRFAPNRWALTADYEVARGLRLTAELLIVSSQFEAAGQPRNDGYAVLNAAAAYRLPWRWGPLRDLTAHVKVTNLLNEDYAEVRGFPALGTHVVAGLRAGF